MKPVEALLHLAVADDLVIVEVDQEGGHGGAVIVRPIECRLHVARHNTPRGWRRPTFNVNAAPRRWQGEQELATAKKSTQRTIFETQTERASLH